MKTLDNVADVRDNTDMNTSTEQPVYYEFGDGPAARASRIEEIARRLLTEYEEDLERSPSFVTMGLLREALDSEPRPSRSPERQYDR